MRKEHDTKSPEARRKEIFRVLVEAQDRGLKVSESFELISQQFGVDYTEINQIVVDGLDGEWPPLD